MLTASKIMLGEFTVNARFWTVKLRLVKKQRSVYYHHEKLGTKKHWITLVILHVEVERKLQLKTLDYLSLLIPLLPLV